MYSLLLLAFLVTLLEHLNSASLYVSGHDERRALAVDFSQSKSTLPSAFLWLMRQWNSAAGLWAFTGVKWYQYHLLQLFQQMPRDLKAWFSPTPETQIIKDHSITTTGAGSSKTGHDETRHALPTPFLWLFNNSAILVNWGYFSKPKQTPHSKRLVLTIRVLTFPLLIHKLT